MDRPKLLVVTLYRCRYERINRVQIPDKGGLDSTLFFLSLKAKMSSDSVKPDTAAASWLTSTATAPSMS